MDSSNPMTPEETNNTTKPRILLADDSKLVQKTGTKILSERFDLILAGDGEEAWEKLTSDPSISVVFTDLGMPNLDGYGLIERIRGSDQERIADTPVIVITGAAEEESVKRRVFELGATDFVGKPFKSTEIIARADAHAAYRSDKETLQQNLDVDLLTGTLNRKGLEEKLEKDVSFINRHGQNLAVIVFDLDNFREVAQKIGRKAAEKIIQHIAKTLGKAIRKEDSFGRYQFSQFITVLPMAKAEGVVQLARRLCEHVKSLNINIGGQAVPVTLTVGISAVQKGSTTTASDMLKSAHQALANAQAIGAGEVQILKPDAQPAKPSPAAISIDELLESIEHGQTELSPEQASAVVEKLAPLAALLPAQHRQALLG